jgi:hypothetical protein
MLYLLFNFLISLLILIIIIIIYIILINIKKCESLDNRIFYHENSKSKYFGLKSGIGEKSLFSRINGYITN